MKTRLLALAIALATLTACSSDDTTVIEEPIIDPVAMCDCVVSVYQVQTTGNGTPIDTTIISTGTVDTGNGLLQQECGYYGNATLVNTVTMFGYQYQETKCGEQ